MNSSNSKKFTIADVLANFGKKQAEVQQEKLLKDQLKEALMQNQAQALGQFVPGMQQQMPPQEQEMTLDQAYQQAKQGGIHLDPSKKGTFKAQATRMGMSIQEAAAHILANKDNYSPAMRRKANFARNFAKEEGGETDMMKKGGQMIKRADGSYSQRGLWDNIRANRGSGKQPTREMLEQERKIRKKAIGGMISPSDCPEGYEWDDMYQVCAPVAGTVAPEAIETSNFMKNWYNNRAQILNDPEYMSAITDPEFPNDAKKDVARLRGNIQEMQNQYNQSGEGEPITPIEYTGPLGNPDALGEYIYDDNGGIGSIRVRKDELLNPVDQKATMAHEWTTAGTHNFTGEPEYKKFYSNLLADNLMSWEDFRDRAIAEGKVGAKDKAGLNMLEGNYDYSVSPIEDNIHSNINVARQLFNLQPTDVITEEKIDEMMKIAEEKGYVDKNSPNYIDDIYRLYRLKKDNKSLANMFNLLASSGEGKNDVLGSDIQMAKYGGNIGKLRKFF